MRWLEPDLEGGRWALIGRHEVLGVGNQRRRGKAGVSFHVAAVRHV
jgi:hypothetical protein